MIPLEVCGICTFFGVCGAFIGGSTKRGSQGALAGAGIAMALGAITCAAVLP